MSKTLVVIRTETSSGQLTGRGLWIWCPGCRSAHRPRVANEDGSQPATGPYWDWNGRTDGGFTISPSLLCYSSAHLCPEEYEHYTLCNDGKGCDKVNGHAILNENWRDTDERVLGHNKPHVIEPAWGNCHSFIREGQWQFLGDCEHKLAGQTVPMVPVPDWMVR